MWDTKRIDSASSSYFTLGKSLCKLTLSQPRCQTQITCFPCLSLEAQVHEAGVMGAKQAQAPGRSSKTDSLDWGWHAAAKQHEGTTHSPALESHSRQHLAPLTLNVSLQMEATDHQPFPSAAVWSHPEPISLCPACASWSCVPWKHTSATSLPKSPKYNFVL